MDEKLKIINSALLTLELIPVSGTENHERILGIAAGLRDLRRLIQQENEKKEEKPNG